MIGMPSMVAELLAKCDANGIRLFQTGDGGLTIDAPQDALTADLLDRLKDHKDDILAALGAIDDPHRSPAETDEERKAIQWVENGPKADVDAAFDRAVAEWCEVTGILCETGVPSAPAPADVPSCGSEARNVPPPGAAAAPTPAMSGRRLIGCGFAPIAPTIPPDAILATPPVTCPACRKRPVLPELRELTGGQCWDCWAASNSPAARS
jgi:TubC N-terminal docking domain